MSTKQASPPADSGQLAAGKNHFVYELCTGFIAEELLASAIGGATSTMLAAPAIDTSNKDKQANESLLCKPLVSYKLV